MRRLMVAGAPALAFVVPGLMAPAEALAFCAYLPPCGSDCGGGGRFLE